MKNWRLDEPSHHGWAGHLIEGSQSILPDIDRATWHGSDLGLAILQLGFQVFGILKVNWFINFFQASKLSEARVKAEADAKLNGDDEEAMDQEEEEEESQASDEQKTDIDQKMSDELKPDTDSDPKMSDKELKMENVSEENLPDKSISDETSTTSSSQNSATDKNHGKPIKNSQVSWPLSCSFFLLCSAKGVFSPVPPYHGYFVPSHSHYHCYLPCFVALTGLKSV